MLIDTLRKTSQAQLTFGLWCSLAPAVVSAVFAFLALGDEQAQLGPSFFFAMFVASVSAAGASYQRKVDRALLAEIDALRSHSGHSEDDAIQRSAPPKPTA